MPEVGKKSAFGAFRWADVIHMATVLVLVTAAYTRLESRQQAGEARDGVMIESLKELAGEIKDLQADSLSMKLWVARHDGREGAHE